MSDINSHLHTSFTVVMGATCCVCVYMLFRSAEKQPGEPVVCDPFSSSRHPHSPLGVEAIPKAYTR